MNDQKLKASEIIKNSCCGALLDVPVFEMVKKIEALEDEIVLLNNQLKNAQRKIQEAVKNER